MYTSPQVARQQLDLSASYSPIAIKQWKLSPSHLKPLKQQECVEESYSPLSIERVEQPQSKVLHGSLTPSCASSSSSLDKYSDSTQYSTSEYINILSVGNVYSYTIPSFNVLTVHLRHVEVSTTDDSKFDAFVKEDTDISFNLTIPVSLKIINSCKVKVRSVYSNCPLRLY